MEKVIAICGAGGKTTMIRRLAEKYRSQGKKVLVTTTTKMFREAFTVTDSEKEMKQALAEGFVMAGTPFQTADGSEKITALPEDVYARLCAEADIVLVEADGSRHHSVKVPNETDIVLPSNVTDIYIIMGTGDIGRPVTEAVHRSELLADLGIAADALLSQEIIDTIIDRKYLQYCRKNAQNASCRIFYSYMENETLQFTERI